MVYFASEQKTQDFMFQIVYSAFSFSVSRLFFINGSLFFYLNLIYCLYNLSFFGKRIMSPHFGCSFIWKCCVFRIVCFATKMYIKAYIIKPLLQQQPDLLLSTGRPDSIFTLLAVSVALDGGPTRFLISAAIVMNACSTFVAFLADVSRNGMPNWFAYSCKTRIRSH